MLCIAWLYAGCGQEQGALVLQFTPYVGDEPLEFGKKYPAPNGDGTYYVSDFMFYVSNVRLMASDGEEFLEPDSYHLLKFPQGETYSIVLDSLQAGTFDKLALSIGIDSAANLSADRRGDLDPTNPMAWSWTDGYKFLLLEGKYMPVQGSSIPLVYHPGFSENRKVLAFDLAGAPVVEFKVDVNALFTSPNPIDFHTHPEILFNAEHTALLAANYAEGFISRK